MAVTVSGKQEHILSIVGTACFLGKHRGICDTETYTPAVLRLRDGVGTSLAVVLGHIFTLFERGCLILQNVPDTESIAV